jgi:hypothetical protein
MNNEMPIELQIENAISALLKQIMDNPATDYTEKQAGAVRDLASALFSLRHAA